jgi:ATP-dependent Clp protease ATP-binding subunit ClpB
MRMDKFTHQFQKALADAQSKAVRSSHNYIEVEHVLCVMLQDEEFGVRHFLENANLNVNNFRDDLDQKLANMPTVHGNEGEVHLSRDFVTILNICDKIAAQRKDQYIATDIFLLALLKQDGNVVALMKKNGLDVDALNKTINDSRQNNKIDSQDAEQQFQALDKYTINLTKKALAGKLDPVIGRDDEIRRSMQVLQRRTKNNPVLIGEPGVGKTAIAEGLAQRIINNEVPEGLKNKQLLCLDLAALIAGAKFRGEFEQRLKAVLKELAKLEGKAIIFIDELHTVVGAGNADGAMDAGNILKPALARGDLHCIGATTLNEYRQYIEKDAALERRFQKVMVKEPDEETTIAILRGLKERYEVHHGVSITDSAIIAAVNFSSRYINDRFLPDKAIDLMDEAASRIRMEIDSKPEVMDKLSRKIIQLKMEQQVLTTETDDLSKEKLHDLVSQINDLEKKYADFDEVWSAEKAAVTGLQAAKEELDRLRIELDNAKRSGDLARMSEIQYGLIPACEQKIAAADKMKGKNFKLLRNSVEAEEIAEVVAKQTGIPVAKMLQGEKEKLLNLEKVLHESVIGQEIAIKKIADCIRRSRSGLSDPKKPIGSFLFLGPTGVGKTELCKSLARFMFDSENIIRIDMSEYMEKHAVAKLIGAPPGYVGYEEGGYLTEKIRRQPYAVILLDEVEKAHQDVFNLLLQVLDEGRLTDNQGRTVNFKNTIIVMTSNLGAEEIKNNYKNYDKMYSSVMKIVGKYFRVEFLNRIDDSLVFYPLTKENIFAITKIQFNYLKKRLLSQGIEIDISDNAVQYIADIGFDAVYGARFLKRTIQQYIENPLSKKILLGDLENKIIIDIANDKSEIILK